MRRSVIALCFSGLVSPRLSARCPRLAQTQIELPITKKKKKAKQRLPPRCRSLPPTLSADLRIVWEVKNRFRLFGSEADFASTSRRKASRACSRPSR